VGGPAAKGGAAAWGEGAREGAATACMGRGGRAEGKEVWRGEVKVLRIGHHIIAGVINLRCRVGAGMGWMKTEDKMRLVDGKDTCEVRCKAIRCVLSPACAYV